MKKKVLALILAVAMLASCLPLSASAAVELGSVGTFSILSKTAYGVTPGVTETDILLNTAGGHEQNMGYVMEIDTTRSDVTLRAGYRNYDGTRWGMQTSTLQAAAAETALKKQDPNANVVGVINASFFNMATGEPSGPLVMNGDIYKGASNAEWSYLAVLKDGTVEIRDGSVPVDSTVREAMGGREFLMRDGNIVVTPANDPSRLPRAAVGITADKKVVLYVNDGRQAPKSVGMSVYELAQVMKSFGCVDALNLDGGGSATFASKREGTGKLAIQNSPSDGYERAVSGTIMVVSTAKASGEFDHASLSPKGEAYTPGSEVTFSALGVDSTGAEVALPEGLTYALAAESQSLGAITADGVFTSNGTEGAAQVQLLQGGQVVGSTEIHLQAPDSLSFLNDAVNLKYSQETDLGLSATWHGLPLHFKEGDFLWEVGESQGNGDVGAVTGNLFTASPNNEARNLSATADVTATSRWDASVKATIEVSVGKEPVVVLDGGDNDGHNYENIAYVYANPSGGGLVYETHPDDHGDVVVVHYANRGGQSSARVINLDNGEVRFGEKALRLDYDFTKMTGTEGACLGFSEDMEIPGSPTGIGFWCYAPENTPNLWIRIRVRDGSGTIQTMNFTAENSTPLTGKVDSTLSSEMNEWSKGTHGGINWVGWRYLECDLSNVVGPITLMGGETVRIMALADKQAVVTDLAQAGMGRVVCQKDDTGEIVYGPKYVGPSKGSLYIDNLQLVYGTNNADIDNPVIRKLQAGPSLDQATDLASDGSTVIAGNSVTFYTEYADVENENTTGLEISNIYVDGANMSENPNCVTQLQDGRTVLNDVRLPNGTHTVRGLVRDGYGNEATVSRSFVVEGDDESLTAIRLEAEGDTAPLGGRYPLKILTNHRDDVRELDVTLKVENASVPAVEFDSDFAGSTFDFDAAAGLLTLHAVRAEGAAKTGDGPICTVMLSADPTLLRSNKVAYTVTAGEVICEQVTLVQEEPVHVVSTFAVSRTEVPVAAAYEVSCDLAVQGAAATEVRVTKADGTPAAGVQVVLSAAAGEQVLGVTDAAGVLSTAALGKLSGEQILIARGEDGCSFQAAVNVLPAQGDASGKPYNILENATENAFSTKSISWMTNGLTGGDKAVVEYALSSAYASTGAFTDTVQGVSELHGFQDAAVRLNSVKITGLQVDTEYTYRVGDGSVWSDVRTFSTIDNDEDAVTHLFLVGDTQTAVGETDNLGKINQYLASDPSGRGLDKDYSLGIQLGDAVEEPILYSSWQYFLNTVEKTNGAFAQTDMLHVIGNHELMSDPGATAAKSIFSMDPEKPYYSVTYGNVYVATMDYSSDAGEIRRAMEWLKEDAKASDAPWKILVMHQPPYFTNALDGVGEIIHELVPPAVDEAGIDLVFSGHDHSYARTLPLTDGQVDEENGAVYFICGSTGEKSYEITNDPNFHFAVATQDYEGIFLGVEAAENEISVTTYDLTDMVQDTDGTGPKPVLYQIIDTYHKAKYDPCQADAHRWVYRPGKEKLLCSLCHARLDRAGYTGFAQLEGDEEHQVYLRNGEPVISDWIVLGEKMYYAGPQGIVYECEVKVGATCTTGGYDVYTCKEYNVTKRAEQYNYPSGHVWATDANGQYVLDADGHRTCSVCGKAGTPLSEVTFRFGTIDAPRTDNTTPRYVYQESGIRPASFGTVDGVTALTSSNDDRLIDGRIRDLFVSWPQSRSVGNATVHYVGRGDYYGEVDLAYIILPGDVTNLRVINTTADSVTLAWDAAGGAGYYQVYQTSAAGSGATNGMRTEATSVLYTGLQPGTTYSFKAASRTLSGGAIFNAAHWSNVVTVTTKETNEADQVTDITATVDGTAFHAQTIGAARYLFLPAHADLTALPLTVETKTAGAAVLLQGGKGEAAPGAAVNVAALADPVDSTRELTVLVDGQPQAYLRVMQNTTLRSLFLTSADPAAKGREYVDTSKKNVAAGTMRLLDPQGTAIYDGALSEIHARGNSTFNYAPKKSYQIKLGEKSDLLGTGEKVTTWVLLAGYDDATKVHDKTMKDLATSLGMQFVASSDWVALYYDGEFRGIYQLGEKNSVKSTGVDITDLEKAYEALNEDYGQAPDIKVGQNRFDMEFTYTDGLTDPEDFTGGFLLELNGSTINEASGFKTKQGKALNVKSPEWASEAAMKYVSEYYQEFEDAVYATDESGVYTGVNPETGKHYYEYFDKDSLVQVFLLQELSLNPDGFYSSMFSYKEAGSIAVCGPLWDQELVFGSGWNKRISATASDYRYLSEALIQIPDFQQAVRTAYNETFAPAARQLLGSSGILAANTGRVTDAVLMDHALWPYVAFGDPSKDGHLWKEGTTYSAIVSDMLTWVETRLGVLDERFPAPDPGPTTPPGPVEPTPTSEPTTEPTASPTTSPEPTAPLYKDVEEGKWYYDAVRFVSEHDIMKGVGDSKFDPNGTLTRAMMAQILYNMESGTAPATLDRFTDVPAAQWYAPAVNWAAENGLMNGVGNGKFDPTSPLTREQMAKVLYSYCQYKQVPAEPSGSLEAFPDGNKVSSWAKEPVQWAVAQKLIQGFEDGTLRPTGTATRAQVATVLTNFCQKILEMT